MYGVAGQGLAQARIAMNEWTFSERTPPMLALTCLTLPWQLASKQISRTLATTPVFHLNLPQHPSPTQVPSSASIYTSPCISSLAASPQSTDHIGKRTGAVVKRLWAEGQRWGISATEMSRVRLPGSEAKPSKKKKKEGFRTRLPPSDRRVGLVGELFDFFLSPKNINPFPPRCTVIIRNCGACLLDRPHEHRINLPKTEIPLCYCKYGLIITHTKKLPIPSSPPPPPSPATQPQPPLT